MLIHVVCVCLFILSLLLLWLLRFLLSRVEQATTLTIAGTSLPGTFPKLVHHICVEWSLRIVRARVSTDDDYVLHEFGCAPSSQIPSLLVGAPHTELLRILSLDWEKCYAVKSGQMDLLSPQIHEQSTNQSFSRNL